jgi:hypothetical protein
MVVTISSRNKKQISLLFLTMFVLTLGMSSEREKIDYNKCRLSTTSKSTKDGKTINCV